MTQPTLNALLTNMVGNRPNQINQVSALLEMITTQSRAELVANNLACPANMNGAKASARERKLYYRIDVGSSSRYFIRKTDGMIFASASTTTPNFHRSFGTLDTIADFAWGGYEARALPGTPWVMKGTRNGYCTAVAV